MNGPGDPLLQADLAMGITHAPRRHDQAPRSAEPPPMTATAAVAPAMKREASAPSPPAGSAAPSALRVGAATVGASTPLHNSGDRGEALEALRARHDRECPHCTVSTSHTRTVFGEGDPMSRLMFVGEAPGETEDREGRPFVGRAGEKLDEMIRAMGLRREQVYIANVLKSRPPENRTPLQHEVDACGPFLIEQLLIIRPEVIVTLGGPATKLLLGTETGITRLRGIWSQWQPPGDGASSIPVMPTYHPAYLLRNYTPKTRGEVWSDLKAVMERLGLGKS